MAQCACISDRLHYLNHILILDGYGKPWCLRPQRNIGRVLVTNEKPTHLLHHSQQPRSIAHRYDPLATWAYVVALCGLLLHDVAVVTTVKLQFVEFSCGSSMIVVFELCNIVNGVIRSPT